MLRPGFPRCQSDIYLFCFNALAVLILRVMTVFSSFLFLVPGTGRDRNIYLYIFFFGAVGFGIVFLCFRSSSSFCKPLSRIKAFLLFL